MSGGIKLAYITYQIVYGNPTRFLPVHITVDRHEAHVVSSKYRNDTGYDYIVYAFTVEDVGSAMMTGEKDYVHSYQYAAKRLQEVVISGKTNKG